MVDLFSSLFRLDVSPQPGLQQIASWIFIPFYLSKFDNQMQLTADEISPVRSIIKCFHVLNIRAWDFLNVDARRPLL